MFSSSMLISVLLTILVGAIGIGFIRLARGPHLLDRVMTLDFMAVVLVGILGLYAVVTDQRSYLDVALVVALLSFLATIGFTYYVTHVHK